MGKTRRAPVGSVAGAGVEWSGVTVSRIEYPDGGIIFAQGEPAQSVMFVERGSVRLSVVSQGGKEAVIAVLESQNFSAKAVWRVSQGAWRLRPRWISAPS